MQILVNNVEQVQPDGTDNVQIILYGRTAEAGAQRQRVVVEGFRPYFYARESEVQENEDFLLSNDFIDEIRYGEYTGLEGDELAKIFVPKPQNTREAREHFEQTWAADVPFTRRFRVDTNLRSYVEVPDPTDGENEVACHWREISPVEPGSRDATPGGQGGETGLQNVSPRVVTLDIEADDRHGFPEAGEERILSVVAHDSYTDETIAFFDGDDRPIEEMFPDGAPEGIDELYVEPNEKQMLIRFGCWIDGVNPDIIGGWNVDFDMGHLIERMSVYGSEGRLSPERQAWVGRDGPNVKGRTVYDFLEAYKKNSRHELDSHALDDVAKEELGEEKITFDGSYFGLYQRDPYKFIDYNARDVHLTVGINEAADVLAFRDTLRRQVGVDFEDSFDNKDFIDTMCRRELKEMGKVGPTRQFDGGEDYEGAHVFEPYEGVAENVAALDLASLYPYTMAMLNASPETRVKSRSEAEGNVVEASNGILFDQATDGLFKRLVDKAIGLKSDFKEELQEAESAEARAKYERMYAAAKTITNSIYGVIGWERFFLYDKDVAEAVTLTGQYAIQQTASEVQEWGYEVIYGDTDSVYVQLTEDTTRDDVFDLVATLNNDVYPDAATDLGLPREDNLWEIEFEAHIERFFQAGKKKRYAYTAIWKDGHEVEDPEPKVKGFELVRSDAAQITNDVQGGILHAILDGNSEAVGDILFEAAQKIEPDDPDWDYIGIPGGLNQKISLRNAGKEGYYAFDDKGYPQDAQPRAVWNTNQLLNTNIGEGDKPKRVYVVPEYFEDLGREINVIGFEEASDIEPITDKLTVDVNRMLQTTVVRPARRMAEAVGVDPNAAVKGQTQIGLSAFSND